MAEGEREEALVYAFTTFGLTPEEIEQLRASPTWPARVAAAHTVPREVKSEEAYQPAPEHFRHVAAPTLLGEESPEWAPVGTERVRAILPQARVAVLPGQGHVAIMTAPDLVAEEISGFLSE